MSRTSTLLLLTLVGACGVDDHGSSLPSARLTSLTDCNAAASYIKEAAVKRSLFLDNFVYSISDSELRVRDINAMASDLVTLPLD